MKEITSIGEILFDVYPDKKKLGGAPFNFIYHVINLIGNGNFISRVGNDGNGNKIISFLKRNNISTKFIQIDKTHSTGEAKPTLSDSKVPDWKIKLNRAYDFIKPSKEIDDLIENNIVCLYFGTLAQRKEESRKTIQSLFNKKIKYFCDLNIRQNFYSKEIIKKSLKVANVLKLNEDELKLVNKLILNSNYEFEKSSLEIKNNFNIDLLCVTKGEDGAVLFKDDEINNYKTKINKDGIVDTVGAGDAYASILCIGFLKNWSLEKINKTASEFAGKIVKINGALPDKISFYDDFKEKIK